MKKVLSVSEVANLVADRVLFDKRVVTNEPDRCEIAGNYRGQGAGARVYLSNGMLTIEANNSNELEDWRINFPMLAEDATTKRINRYLDFLGGQ